MSAPRIVSRGRIGSRTADGRVGSGAAEARIGSGAADGSRPPSENPFQEGLREVDSAAPGDGVRRSSSGPLAACLLSALAVVASLPGALSAQAGPPGTDASTSPEAEEGAPLVGDRPDFTESATAVGRLQLETGYTYEDAGPSDVHTVGELLVRVPAGRRLELRIGVPSWSWTDAGDPPDLGPGAELPGEGPRGITDASLGLKLGLREPGPDGGGPAVALLAGTTVPTGGDLGSDGFHPGGRLAAALDLSERLSLGANGGVASAEAAGERHAELSGSLALGVAASGAVGAYLEGYGFVPTGEGPDASSVVNGGLTWLAGPDLQLDVRVGTGLSGPSPDLIFGTGVVWRP